MNSMQHLDVTYMQWKNMRTFLGGNSNSYYIQSPEGYVLVLVDLPRKFVTTSHLRIGNPTGQTSVIDFEATLKETSIAYSTIDDCVAAAIIG